ncbi:MAG: hypothetical protein ACRC28_17500 [Clostridium sp.]|uniref:hypothetical protein n=1 Tax=Clostridium sp. TaxID=1506 RepID=UPI003F310ED7
MDLLRRIFRGRKYNRKLELRIPKGDFYRTELLCSYITKELDEEFYIEHFLMSLYLDFVKNVVKSYNIKEIYKMLKNNYKKTEKTLRLVKGNSVEDVVIYKEEYKYIEIIMENDSIRQGELILLEVYEAYRIKISFEELLEKIWLKFISEYKNEKKSYTSLIKIIENVI